MTFQFYGYTVRSTVEADRTLAASWSFTPLKADFWLRQDGCENFLVTSDEPLLFFQTEHVGQGDQVRLHWQPSPTASPKKLLTALTMLVPLVEKALALRGVRAIFFTSHSDAMCCFMRKRLGYRYAGDGGMDGVMMSKGI